VVVETGSAIRLCETPVVTGVVWCNVREGCLYEIEHHMAALRSFDLGIGIGGGVEVERSEAEARLELR
jgi:hypothetical protein